MQDDPHELLAWIQKKAEAYGADTCAMGVHFLYREYRFAKQCIYCKRENIPGADVSTHTDQYKGLIRWMEAPTSGSPVVSVKYWE